MSESPRPAPATPAAPAADPTAQPVTDLRLYSGAPQVENFCRMDSFGYPVSRLRASPEPQPFPAGEPYTLPDTYEFEGTTRSTEDFLSETGTVALLVLQDGHLRYESYRLTGGPEVPWLSFSVAKSFVATLVGIAIDEGYIRSVADPISDYVQVEPGSAYDGVRIVDVLHMSSGARWQEDYSDPDSDIHAVALSSPRSYADFVAHMVKDREPDTLCRYASGDTLALGLLVAAASGTSLTDYMQRTLCDSLGFESPGFWITDPYGVERAFGSLNLVARDYAKLGELYRRRGVAADGTRIVSEAWVEAATHVDSPIRLPGRPELSGNPTAMGYGYQWWIPEGDRGEFAAVGVYNQGVNVDPVSRTTIVKLSANPRFGLSTKEEDNRGDEQQAFLRALARDLSR